MWWVLRIVIQNTCMGIFRAATASLWPRTLNNAQGMRQKHVGTLSAVAFHSCTSLARRLLFRDRHR